MSSNAHAATQRNRAMADKDCVTLSYFFFFTRFSFSIRTSLFSRPRFQKSQEKKEAAH